MGFINVTLGQPPTCNAGLPPVFPQRLLGPDAHRAAPSPAAFLDAAQMPGRHLCWLPAHAPVPCAGHLAWAPTPTTDLSRAPGPAPELSRPSGVKAGTLLSRELGGHPRWSCAVSGERQQVLPAQRGRNGACASSRLSRRRQQLPVSVTRKGRDAWLSSAGPVAMLSSRSWTGSAGPYSSSQSSCWDHGNPRDRRGDRGSVGLTDTSHTGGRWRTGALWPGVRLGYEQVQMERLARQPLELPQGARAASRYKTHQAASGGA